jgi:hypothetical protein
MEIHETQTYCTNSAAGSCDQNSLSEETSGVKDGHFNGDAGGGNDLGKPYQVINVFPTASMAFYPWDGHQYSR